MRCSFAVTSAIAAIVLGTSLTAPVAAQSSPSGVAQATEATKAIADIIQVPFSASVTIGDAEVIGEDSSLP
jgi:hypothetical protein